MLYWSIYLTETVSLSRLGITQKRQIISVVMDFMGYELITIHHL